MLQYTFHSMLSIPSMNDESHFLPISNIHPSIFFSFLFFSESEPNQFILTPRVNNNMNIGPNDLLREFVRNAAGKPSIALNFALLSTASILMISTFLASIEWPIIPIIQFSFPSFYLNWPSPISIFVFAIFLIYSFFEFHWKRRFLPPGPMPWWIAGNMPQVFLHGPRNIDGLMQQWKAKYGGIFTFWMGPIPMVMVSDVELLRRYFLRNGDVFSGRWQNFITHTFMDGHNGVIQIQGDKWREQRRFSLHVLRDFGVGRTMMEEKIKVEVKALIQHLEAKLRENDQKTGEMDICKPIAVCIANIINNILFGMTYAHDDPSIIRVQQMLDRQSILVVQPWMGLYLTLPWTTKIPLIDSAWRKLLSIRNEFWAFLEGHIQEHVHKFNPNLEPTDFTFSYLAEIYRRKKETANKEGHFSQKQLKMLLLDLFFAGSETTVTTTKWGILLLILHPEVQERCCQEMAQKIGKKEPELKDRNKLVYLNATICEIQRLANILPINLLRTCLENVQIDGFKFAKGTMVLPQISITMNDQAYFPEPHKFNPDRFIDEKMGNLQRIDAFLPFSIGKRQCLGESLARAELFFIFAYLIRHFQFLPENAQKLPSTKRIYGLTCSPQPFKCRLIRRIINKNVQNMRANA